MGNDFPMGRLVVVTTGGTIGAETAHALADCVEPINAWAAAAELRAVVDAYESMTVGRAHRAALL